MAARELRRGHDHIRLPLVGQGGGEPMNSPEDFDEWSSSCDARLRRNGATGLRRTVT